MPAPIIHLELHTGALEQARDLYAGLCGWDAEDVSAAGRTYTALDTGGGVAGGIVECATPRSLWLPYVEVPDVRAAVGQARTLGAAVALHVREGPLGWRAVVATRAGAELAFWQSKR